MAYRSMLFFPLTLTSLHELVETSHSILTSLFEAKCYILSHTLVRLVNFSQHSLLRDRPYPASSLTTALPVFAVQ